MGATPLEFFQGRVQSSLWLRELISVFLVLLSSFWVSACDPRQASRVDDCLDRGGSYDYEAETCDFERNHPVPK